jgi:alpha-beta hydrolase superfamily lysophospholipase
MLARHYIETGALTTGPNGRGTPGDYGVPFEHVHIASGPSLLDAFLVRAPAACVDAPTVVIYHGVKETISMWTEAQDFLYQHCVSSVVFDYTGSGDSSRPAKFEALGKDSVAAYFYARLQFPGKRVFVMGHSMGNGPMLAALPQFTTPPNGIIIANAFSSLRDFGKRSGVFYGLLARTAPDWWNNVKAVQRAKSPILVVHSESDTVNPLAGAQKIYANAPQPKQIAVLHGHKHNDLYKTPTDDWWTPALKFMVTDPPPRDSTLPSKVLPN